MRSLHLIAVAVVLAVTCYAQPSSAGGAATAVTNAAKRRIEAALCRQELKREALRDLNTPVTRLPESRIVWRYTTRQHAQLEQRAGIASNRHLTAQRSGSKPLSACSAQWRFGLCELPEVRETIVLPKGTPVRINTAWRGLAQEITSPQPLPPTAIIEVRPLQQ